MSQNEALPLSAAHDPDPRKPSVAVPASACDCHAHVFGPGNKYPFISTGLYTPADALPKDFRHMLDVLGVARGVLTQPSIYGTNNDALLDAIKTDPARLRGIAVVPFDVDEHRVARLNEQGIRGVRLNIVDLKAEYGKGKLDVDALRKLANRIKPFGWHVEFLMHVDEFPDLDRLIGHMPVEFCFGHLGYVYPERGVDTAGFKALLRLMRDGKAWVKLTAPYRLTAQGKPWTDVDPFAQALLDAAPGRLVWGSDWPHVHPQPGGPGGKQKNPPMPNDGDLFDCFVRWVPDEAARRRILVDNPAALYGFR
ncbi:MAG: amidohydrolase family protein [Bacteroidota bacterium]